MAVAWTGWLLRRGVWQAIASAATLGECGRAVDAELRRRGLRVPNRAICLTAHGSPPLDRPAQATAGKRNALGVHHEAQTAKATLDRPGRPDAAGTL